MMEFFAGPWGPLLIFGLRIVDVSMATVRMLTVVRRRDVRDVTRTVERHDPDAFVTVQNDAFVQRGWLYPAKRG